jgi:hypothetical protein
MRMTSVFKTLLFSLAALAMAGAPLHAGAWTPMRGGWYLEESVSFFQSNLDFSRSRQRQRKPEHGEFRQTLAKTYVEYGITSDIPVSVSLPYKRVRYVDDYSDIDNAGVQDLQIGTRWKFYDKNTLVMSLSAAVTTPAGDYKSDEPLALGDRRSNPEMRLLVGKTFWPVKSQTPGQPDWSRAYAGAEIGKDRFSMPYVLEGGAFAAPWLLCKAELRGVSNLPQRPDGQDYLNWFASITLTSEGSNNVLRTDTRQALNLSLGYGNILSGRNTGGGPTTQVSLSYSF